MKILFIIHDFLPTHQAGSEIYTYLLARELSKNHDVLLLFTEIHNQKTYRVTSRTYQGLNCLEVYRPCADPLKDSSYNDAKMAEIFKSVLTEFDPDVIHLQHLLFHSLGYPAIARDKGIPIIFTLHDYWLTCPHWGRRMKDNLELCHEIDVAQCAECMQGSSEPQFHSLVTRICRLLGFRGNINHAKKSIEKRLQTVHQLIHDIDLFICPSPFLTKTFADFGVPEEKLSLISHGFETTRFQKKKGVRSNGLRFGYIGTISEHKGIHILVEAFSQLPEKEATLEIYGDLDWFPSYSKQLKSAANSSGIRFHGAAANEAIPDILNRIDILVVPSIWFENSPLTIHEAFLAGVPVITSNLGGMADLVTHQVNGLLFEVGNTDDLAEKMSLLIAQPDLVGQLQQSIPKVKSIKENGAEIEALYHRLIRTDSVD